MILTDYIELKWTKRNRMWLESKGYEFTEYSNLLKIKPLDSTIGSHKIIELQCDYCEKKISMEIRNYFKQLKNTPIKKDCCGECQPIKNKESLLFTYGIDNVMKLEKSKESLKSTIIKKYGVESYSMTEEYKTKVKETCMDKYGVEYYVQTEEYKDKVKKTNLSRYGTTSPLKNEIVINKRLKTLFRQGNAPASKQQIYLCELVNGVLNYPVGRSSLDIVLIEDMIYIEYDGGGHDLSVTLGNISKDEFDRKQVNRSFYLKDLGWREVRILCKSDKLPPKNFIVKIINKIIDEIKNNKSSYFIWNIDTCEIIKSNKFRIKDFEFINNTDNWERI